MLNKIAEYFQKMFQSFEKPQTYGTALEAYIMCHSPQSVGDIDRLTRQFDLSQVNHKGW
jgi:hypothetical protein